MGSFPLAITQSCEFTPGDEIGSKIQALRVLPPHKGGSRISPGRSPPSSQCSSFMLRWILIYSPGWRELTTSSAPRKSLSSLFLPAATAQLSLMRSRGGRCFTLPSFLLHCKEGTPAFWGNTTGWGETDLSSAHCNPAMPRGCPSPLSHALGT